MSAIFKASWATERETRRPFFRLSVHPTHYEQDKLMVIQRNFPLAHTSQAEAERAYIQVSNEQENERRK